MIKRILVADDEPSVRESVGYALQQEGFDVTIATDGDDAGTAPAEGAPPAEHGYMISANGDARSPWRVRPSPPTP